MADVFAALKWAGVNCEMAPEFVKEAVWEGREKVFGGELYAGDQYYIFGNQHYRIHRLIGEVEVILTDSPLLLSSIYGTNVPDIFDDFVLEVFNSFNNLNFYIDREKEYNPKGRLETEEEAHARDVNIRTLLEDKRIPYLTIAGNVNSTEVVTRGILRKLGR